MRPSIGVLLVIQKNKKYQNSHELAYFFLNYAAMLYIEMLYLNALFEQSHEILEHVPYA